MKILTIHGPNLNLLGLREPEIYGSKSLEKINLEIVRRGQELELTTVCRQSNHEGEIIDWLQNAGKEGFSGIIINPAAFTHTSIALRDALLAVEIPFIEVHLSNIYQREAFRQHSYLSDIAVGIIAGLGSQGYDLALTAALTHLLTHL